MPTGIILEAALVVIGGIVGAFVGRRLSDDFKEKMNMVFGCCAMAIGISTIVLMKNLSAVVFSVIVGTAIGLAIHLEDKINAAGLAMQRLLGKFVRSRHEGMPEKEFESFLTTAIVLFCASGTGIYGSIVSGVTGDQSIIMAKAILDFFTAIIFACMLGSIVSLIAIPQFCIFIALFLCAKLIMPLTTETMIADFKACGGFLMLATGFRMIKVKMFPVADMIPAMILVFPISRIWTDLIFPLVG